jgi:hypothetical protein
MDNQRTKSNASGLPLFIPIAFMIFSLSFLTSNHVLAAETFSVDAKIDLKELNHPDKLKVVISANGDSETKYLMGKDLNSDTATVSFELDQKNDIVDVGSRDEYFVCAYALSPLTNQMESYSCAEGNI